MSEKIAGKLTNVNSLPYPEPGQLPRAAFFSNLSDAVKELGGVTGSSMDPAMLRLAITHSGGSTYPAVTATPNVYGIKFRKLHSYTQATGNQTVTKASRNSNSSYDALVLNLAALGTWDDAFYIPQSTDIWCFQVANRWFTWYVEAKDPLVHFKSIGAITAFNATTGQMGAGTVNEYESSDSGDLSATGDTIEVWNAGAEFPADSFGHAVKNREGLYVITSHITNLRLDGTNLQFTIDGTTWATWHTATTCP